MFIITKVASSSIVWSGGCVRTGAVFTSLTTMLKLLVLLRAGSPSSVARTEIVLVLGPCASAGVHVSTPVLGSTLTPDGPFTSAKVNALAGKSESLGIRVDLPFEQEVNPFVELAFEHRTFFTRLHHFVLASDAFIVAPGGIGTVLETMMIWQLLQVRHLEQTPLIMVGRMWPGLISWVRHEMLSFETPLMNAEDGDIPICVADADEAIEIIRAHKESQKAQAQAV